MVDRLLTLLLLGALAAGCSIQRTAVDLVGDAISGGGGVYAADDDPDLVMEAIPFGLKTYESLLEVSPDHRGLLLSAASGFGSYAYLLQDRADRIEGSSGPEARALRERARKLYLRGRDYALRGLAPGQDDFVANLKRDRAGTLARTTREDVAFLYWAGATWAGALSANKGRLDLLAELPTAGALVQRVLDLDEAFDRGAAHEFFISYEAGRPGGSVEAARRHYRRAIELSGGARAGTHLALAESVAVKEQALDEFRRLLAAARAVDADKVRDLRLVNTIAHRRAAWLESRISALFLDADRKASAAPSPAGKTPPR